MLTLEDLQDARPKRRRRVDLGVKLASQLELMGINGFQREFHFNPDREWRLDLAWPHLMLGVECEGFGARGKAGRHQLSQHMHDNCEKHSALAVAGWSLIRVTGHQVRNGKAAQWVQTAITVRQGGTIEGVFAVPWDGGKARARLNARRRWRRAIG